MELRETSLPPLQTQSLPPEPLEGDSALVSQEVVQATARTRAGFFDFLDLVFIFLNQVGVEVKRPGLKLSHFTLALMFLVFVVAAIATIVINSHWPLTTVAAALGFRSILTAILKR